jgi:tetratricopeptide (TPR) repeat protein
MLTGTYPMKHKVQENTATKLPDSALTLAEVLQSNGYDTGGFVGSIVLEAHTGIQQGFKFFDDSFNFHDVKMEDRSGIQKDADSVLRSFQRWHQQKAPGKYFAFVHFYDAHTPYDPPAAFAPKSRAPEDLYRGELQYVDSVIGKLADDLVASGEWNNTILIITGDHGEMFGEHKEVGHGYFVYQQALKVPLLVLLPGHSTQVTIDSTVQLVDLMPTILDLLHIASPPPVQGKSFAGMLQGKKSEPRLAFSESLTATKYFGTAPLHSIQDGRFKFIESPKPELYDLNTDPLEMNNLVEQKKDLASQLKKKVDAVLKLYADYSKKEDSERTPSSEEAERLASLGYISLGKNSAPIDLSRDAKDYIQSWNDLNLLTALLKKEKWKESLELVNRLRAYGTFPIEAEIFEAQAYAGLQNHPKAISILKRVVEADPDNLQAKMALAYSLKNTGQSEEAASIYKLVMDKEGSVLALQNYARQMIRLNKQKELLEYLDQMKAAGKLTERHAETVGEIYLNLNERDQARPYLERALAANPDSYAVYINLSALMASEGRVQEAIQLLENNKARFHHPDFLVQMGRLYGITGNSRKELETFQSMVQLHPQDPRGYFFLGKVLLEHQGDMNQVIQLAETGLSLNPSAEFKPFGYFLLGDAYTALGMHQKARLYLDKAETLRSMQPK